MTKKLEELFDLPTSPNEVDSPIEETRHQLAIIDDNISKIDAALPMVKDLDSSDLDLDEIADLAKESYKDLSDLAMNVDSRFAAELFAVAGTMLGHALTAKTTKLNKKLKMIDLQLKKARLDQTETAKDKLPTGQGLVLNRNELLERILGPRDQNSQKE
jgi:hypothetical protein